MPLIYMHYPKGAFSENALNALADALTTAGLACEKLPDTAFVRSTTWFYANEYGAAKVFVGGKPNGTKVISFEVNVFEGGLDDDAKKQLVKRFTAAVRKHAGIPPEERAPVYIVIREVAPPNWGVFGDRITLGSLRNPPEDARPV